MNYILIGKIVGFRGLKGEMKVYPETDFQTERYLGKKPIYILKNGEYIPALVSKYQPYKAFDLITLENHFDINLVEKFRGCEVFAEDLPVIQKDPNTFHISQVIGISVYMDGQEKGKIQDVKNLPQGDYLVVLKTDQTKSLIPFRDEFIEKIDLSNQRIDLVHYEGLL